MRSAARLLLWTVSALVAVASPSWGSDSARRIDQYKHSRWTQEDGVPAGVRVLVQDALGYLWIGARDGLYRFDGLSFEHVEPVRAVEGRMTPTALLAARDGSVWAGYSSGGITVFRDGVLREMPLPRPDIFIMDVVQTRDGAVWASLGGQVDRQLMRYDRGRWEDVGEAWGLPQDYMSDVLAATDGSLWVVLHNSLHVLRPGTRRFVAVGGLSAGHGALSEDAAGNVWLSDADGSGVVSSGRGLRDRASRGLYPTPAFPRAANAIFDSQGAQWSWAGGTGIHRLQRPEAGGAASVADATKAVTQFGETDGLESDLVSDVIEDREGNIWVASSAALEQFRVADVVSEPELTEPATWGFALLGDSQGNVFVGTADTVYRIRPGGSPEVVMRNAMDVEAICEGPGRTIWIVLHASIHRLQGGRSAEVRRPATTDNDFVDCAVDGRGALWLSAERAGLFRWFDGRWDQLMVPVGDGPAPQAMIRTAEGGLLGFFRPNVFRWIDAPGRADIIFEPSGAQMGSTSLYQMRDDILITGAFGLARLRNGRTTQLSPEQRRVLRGTRGVVQSGADTWLLATDGILRLPSRTLARAFDDPTLVLTPKILSGADGLMGSVIPDGEREVVRGGDGRLWFATTAGMVWVDPARLSRNVLSPRVAISALRVGSTSYRDPVRVVLPAGTTSGEIDYTALSLSVPERVQFRYKLEGVDRSWVDPGQRRQMFFTNLGPGTYRFRVIASNNDGVWNRDGATLEFVIPPTFLQSKVFFILCALLGLSLLWTAYVFRVRQVTRHAQAELEARLSERERIARELHDTLLQGFQGLVLRFQAISRRAPRSGPLRPLMEDALDRADAVLIEGRERVQALRGGEGQGDLSEQLLAAAGQTANDHAARFALTVEGRPRALHPLVHEETLRIGEEAIRNAFQHAQATSINCVLSYRPGQLTFSVRDDGVGFAGYAGMSGERPGHFGLVGMRERAARIGGALSFQSRPGAGAEVKLSIPGRAAYAEQSGLNGLLGWAVQGLKRLRPWR